MNSHIQSRFNQAQFSGVFCNSNGTYTATAHRQSKNFDTEEGAARWYALLTERPAAYTMTPNITHHNTAPDYLRGLICQSGLSQAKVAKRLGISMRSLTVYISAEDARGHWPVPYCVQFALECLAKEVSA